MANSVATNSTQQQFPPDPEGMNDKRERMTTEPGDILDDLFHGCALAAFLEQAACEQGWPDAEATRRRAYQIYEECLAVNNGEE